MGRADRMEGGETKGWGCVSQMIRSRIPATHDISQIYVSIIFRGKLHIQVCSFSQSPVRTMISFLVRCRNIPRFGFVVRRKFQCYVSVEARIANMSHDGANVDTHRADAEI